MIDSRAILEHFQTFNKKQIEEEKKNKKLSLAKNREDRKKNWKTSIWKFWFRTWKKFNKIQQKLKKGEKNKNNDKMVHLWRQSIIKTSFCTND